MNTGFIFRVFLCLLLLSLSHPLAWAEGPTIGSSAVARWTNPTIKADGTPLTNLAGINVWVGTASRVYTRNYNAGLVSSIPISVLRLSDGQYFMAVQAYDSNGLKSGLSSEFAFVLQTPGTASTGTTSTGTTPTGTTPTGTTPTGTIPAISIRNLIPRIGLPGTKVTIVGKNFSGTTAVRFNGTRGTFIVRSNFLIQTVVPVGATTGTVSVTTPAGTAVSDFEFTLPPPVLTNFAPKLRAPGTTVTIIGRYFSGATAVFLSGSRAKFTIMNDMVIRAIVPAGAAAGPISVTTPYGTAISSTNLAVP